MRSLTFPKFGIYWDWMENRENCRSVQTYEGSTHQVFHVIPSRNLSNLLADVRYRRNLTSAKRIPDGCET